MRVNSLQRWQVRALVYALVAVAGLTLLFFARPNRLTHDQIDRTLVVMAEAQPNPFSQDYLLGNPKRALVDNHFAFQFFAWLGRLFRSDEVAIWALLPVVFAIFTVSFFELNWRLTGNAPVSLFVAFIANWHLYIFTAEWGLPGPSGLDPWTLYQAILPLMFLAFFLALARADERTMLLVFLVAGLMGNLHIITAFNIVGAFMLTYVFWQGLSWRTLRFVTIAGLVSVLASAPYLTTHYVPGVQHLTAFNPVDPDARAAVLAVAHHTTLPGLARSLRYWIFNQWYAFWPFVAAMAAVRWWHRREGVSVFDRFALLFLVATFVFNAAFALVQIFRLYVWYKIPFWNQPRGLQYVYLVFLPYLALFLARFWPEFAGWFTRPRAKVFGGVFLVLLVVAAWGLKARLTNWVDRRLHPAYSYHTCDADMYRALAKADIPPGAILHDPDLWAAMRICTRRPVVVQSRDRAFAYSLGSDTMLEWHRRYQAVKRAYGEGGLELIRVAREFTAPIVVSRKCLELPAAEVVRRVVLANEGCIYVLKGMPT
ncbi:hypothetical protein HYW67_02965 [Candidatus Parcubacteria bacterium]|nr:hypothetical protein [Candidatus Parcubacteria bacterium]